jgi:Asp-tRNA(Asn)/Glu-tRNA(Gln) amidotransferase A subunit family amidase
MKNLAASLDTVGFLSAEVATAEQAYRALVPDDAAAILERPRLLFSREPNWHLATPDARSAIEQSVTSLREKGFDIVEGAMPAGFSEMTRMANVIHDYEMHRSLAPEMAAGRDRIDAALVARIERAGRWSVADYRDALRTTQVQRAAFSSLMEDTYDGVLCLAAGSEAPEGLSNTGDPMMNSAWTALHLPCLTLPVMQGATGMPIGLQIVADRFQDLKLLAIGKQIEGATIGPR